MTKLPSVSGKQCVRALEKIDFFIRRQHGSHIIMKRSHPSARVVVPNHATVRKGTLKNILRDAGLTVEEFIELLEESDRTRIIIVCVCRGTAPLCPCDTAM